MSQSRDLVNIWSIYSNRPVLNEKAPAKKMEKMNTKPGPGPVDLNSKAAQNMAHKETSGPNNAKLLQVPLDVKDVGKNKKDAVYGVDRFTLANKKFDESIEKKSKAVINNYMKSIFDKLFEDVMGNDDAADLKALGVDGEEGAGVENGDDGLGTEGGDEVTITLSADQVECLRAVLAQLPEEDVGAEGGEDLGDDLEGDDASAKGNPFGGEEDNEEKTDEDEDEDEVTKEAVATVDNEVDGSGKVLGTAITDGDKLNSGMTKKNNNVVKSTVSRLGKKGSPGNGSVNSTVDGSGKVLGTAISDTEKLNSGMTKVGKGSNLVRAPKMGKTNSDFFS